MKRIRSDELFRLADKLAENPRQWVSPALRLTAPLVA